MVVHTVQKVDPSRIQLSALMNRNLMKMLAVGLAAVVFWSCRQADRDRSAVDGVGNATNALKQRSSSGTKQGAFYPSQSGGSNIVVTIMHDMDEIGVLISSKNLAQRQAGFDRRLKLRRAIDLTGLGLAPLAPELTERLNAGKTPADAAYALSRLGDDHGVLVLQAMASPLESVRLAAAGTAAEFHGRFTLATNAVDPLLLLLKDDFASVRWLAASTVGRLAVLPEKCLPALVSLAGRDPDPMVRRVAVGAVSHFGGAALQVRHDLDRLLHSETDSTVKGAIIRAIQAVDRR